MEGTTEYRQEGRASRASQDGYARLAAAILAKATREAKKGDLDALFWLLGNQAEILSNGIGLSWTHVQKWARAKIN